MIGGLNFVVSDHFEIEYINPEVGVTQKQVPLWNLVSDFYRISSQVRIFSRV